MFDYDPASNRLSLKPGKHPPWIRKNSAREGKRQETWTYCQDCKTQYCKDSSQRSRAHLPFRDRASQMYLRPHEKMQVKEPRRTGEQNAQQPEPEPTPTEAGDDDTQPREDDVVLPVEDENAEVPVPMPPPAKQYPTLEEYQEKWDRELAFHSRTLQAPFSLDCLVPHPIPNLWQERFHRHLVANHIQWNRSDAKCTPSQCRYTPGLSICGLQNPQERRGSVSHQRGSEYDRF